MKTGFARHGESVKNSHAIQEADMMANIQERLEQAMVAGQKLTKLEPREIPTVIRMAYWRE